MNSGVAIDRWETLFKFGLMAGCETTEAVNGTVFAGRKFASRPFLHSSPIASLSHAHLGGYSTATGDPVAAGDYFVLSAVGYGGLFPHTLQAIGNSYTHPNLAGDRAFRSDWSRTFVTGAPRSITLADHSYLANKALWDEFFFSSITPQLSQVRIFENSTTRTAKDVAQDFMFKDIPIPLPNRRIMPYKDHLDPSQLDTLFSSAEATRFTDGLADKIASHLSNQQGLWAQI
jgi:hypothetical protein